MNIKQLIFPGQLTEEQVALTAEIEQKLQTIMEDPRGHFYDQLQINLYKGFLQDLNRRFKKVFPGSKGLYATQSNYYHIQTAIENEFQTTVERPFTFDYSEEVFRFAFLHELAIYLHENKHPVIYPIQVRAITIYLMLYYFNFRDYKPSDYEPAFAFAQQLLDTDVSVIDDIWGDIERFKTEYAEIIAEAQRKRNEERRLMRKSRRVAYEKLMVKELEERHYMAQESFFYDYNKMLDAVAKHYNRSLKSIKQRAKEIGLTKERYNELLPDADYYYTLVQNEISEATEILNRGPVEKRDVWEHRTERFKLFRTFWSPLTPDKLDEEERPMSEDNVAEQTPFGSSISITSNPFTSMTQPPQNGLPVSPFNHVNPFYNPFSTTGQNPPAPMSQESKTESQESENDKENQEVENSTVKLKFEDVTIEDLVGTPEPLPVPHKEDKNKEYIDFYAWLDEEEAKNKPTESTQQSEKQDDAPQASKKFYSDDDLDAILAEII